MACLIPSRVAHRLVIPKAVKVDRYGVIMGCDFGYRIGKAFFDISI